VFFVKDEVLDNHVASEGKDQAVEYHVDYDQSFESGDLTFCWLVCRVFHFQT